jgi:hypothetical protein
MFVAHSIGCFFSGVFLVNTLPHLIHGISGDKFPSPFAKPHGKKLSSPTLNVIWAFMNLLVFLTIFYVIPSPFTAIDGLIMLIGGFVMAVFLSRYFAGKDKE